MRRYHAELRDTVTALLSLPSAPVEPQDVTFLAEPPIGRLLKAVGVRSCDAAVARVPTFARYGQATRFHVDLSVSHPATIPEDVALSLASLAVHLAVKVVYVTSGVDGEEVRTTIPVTLTPNANHRCVDVELQVPTRMPVHGVDTVFIESIAVAGEGLSCGDSGPLAIRVTSGMLPPFTTPATARSANGFNTSPAVSSDGVLYAPVHGQREVRVWAPAGSALPCIDLISIGLEGRTTRTVAICNETGTLFVANEERVVAVSISNMKPIWSAPIMSCFGLAVLPGQGIVVAGSYTTRSLLVFSVSDGSQIFSCRDTPDVVFVAADALSRCIYVSSETKVAAFTWLAADRCFGPREEVLAAGDTLDNRPLTVMPPAFAGQPAHLLVGTSGNPELKIIRLPERTLVRDRKPRTRYRRRSSGGYGVSGRSGRHSAGYL
jgi:hypothetical protein